jgi:hypothetical protein
VRVLRIETPDGRGPYQLDFFHAAPDRSSVNGRRPSPYDDGLNRSVPPLGFGSPWRFGYPSLEAAKEWWVGDEAFIGELARCGACRLVHYEVPDEACQVGKSGKQVMFLAGPAVQVEAQDLSCLVACVGAPSSVLQPAACVAADSDDEDDGIPF